MHPSMRNLVEDHRAIERVLGAMHRTAHELLANRPVDVGTLRQGIAFLEGMLEHCHFPKEEDYLFPALRRVTRATGGYQVAQLQTGHERMRRTFGRVREVLDRLDEGTRETAWAAAVTLTEYWTTISTHIHEEEQACFPHAERVLDPEELNLLMVAFANVETGVNGKPELHELYQAVAEDIADAMVLDDEVLAMTAA